MKTLFNDRAFSLIRYFVLVSTIKKLLGRHHLSGSKYRELDRIDGEPVVFEREDFPGHTTLQLLRREIDRTNQENCMSSSLSVAAYARRFPKRHRSFLRPRTEEQ